ncbi:MAG: hypothetical protein FWC68_04375, partial [Oscillospiraceae bacterium]|nr:hypothetical protein [Oscillospiraceae bacterium]
MNDEEMLDFDNDYLDQDVFTGRLYTPCLTKAYQDACFLLPPQKASGKYIKDYLVGIREFVFPAFAFNKDCTAFEGFICGFLNSLKSDGLFELGDEFGLYYARGQEVLAKVESFITSDFVKFCEGFVDAQTDDLCLIPGNISYKKGYDLYAKPNTTCMTSDVLDARLMRTANIDFSKEYLKEIGTF